eukprot:CAMPEP_0177540728 /NCGR_PEP_ID=MMETSP0369-20130122/59754_1 /TAXON_ID=447022 ORGANISM="Scrippsiella hangoei-like, Strain SHHI-4" /NCGR_SAMPLE_ID=MMETSP0369 /ASSEMBLY_ACC=CAM_ASM_000364 /LENGTH=49 /DNA_ID=CAMNT_0019024003 /DNA_START=208 /DNA_END=357 /DNA_ORIENTATION=+
MEYWVSATAAAAGAPDSMPLRPSLTNHCGRTNREAAASARTCWYTNLCA